MRVIYVDTLFFLNLAVDYLLLLLTARLTGLYVKRRRLLLGAAVGAVLAVLLFFPPLPTALSLFLRAGACAATVLPAFAKGPVSSWPRLMGTFLLLTALLGGVVLALGGDGSRLRMQNGTIYLDVSAAVMLIGFTVMFVLSGLVLGNGRAIPGRGWQEIRVENGGESVQFRALYDSGNLLRDPVSGRQVIVTESAVLAPLFGLSAEVLADLLENLPPEERLARLRQLGSTAFWLLPVRTVTQDGLMVVFLPEKLYVNEARREDCLVGLTTARLGLGGDCRGLMGA